MRSAAVRGQPSARRHFSLARATLPTRPVSARQRTPTKGDTMRTLRSVMLVAAVAALGAIPISLALGATPAAPAVTTAPATNVTETGAVLHGTVNPEGQQTQYAFQWGPTAGYGHETALTSAGTGSRPRDKRDPDGPYARQHLSLPHGRDQRLRRNVRRRRSELQHDRHRPAPDAPPLATTAARPVSGASSATLDGTVNPKGAGDDRVLRVRTDRQLRF